MFIYIIILLIAIASLQPSGIFFLPPLPMTNWDILSLPCCQVGYSSTLTHDHLRYSVSFLQPSGIFFLPPLPMTNWDILYLPCSQVGYSSTLTHDQLRYSVSSLLPSGIFFHPYPWPTEIFCLLPVAKWGILPPLPMTIWDILSLPCSQVGYSSTLTYDHLRYSVAFLQPSGVFFCPSFWSCEIF